MSNKLKFDTLEKWLLVGCGILLVIGGSLGVWTWIVKMRFMISNTPIN
jgi:hypothetical protein